MGQEMCGFKTNKQQRKQTNNNNWFSQSTFSNVIFLREYSVYFLKPRVLFVYDSENGKWRSH